MAVSFVVFGSGWAGLAGRSALEFPAISLGFPISSLGFLTLGPSISFVVGGGQSLMSANQIDSHSQSKRAG
jgi:hypothetical protein